MTDKQLTDQEQQALESYNKKFQRVRDTTCLLALRQEQGLRLSHFADLEYVHDLS